MPRVALTEIHRRDDARAIDDVAVSALSESMNEIGLLSPIHLRRVGSSFELVSGNHRYRAAAKLGWADIEAVIDDFDDIDAELARIDENLCRSELGPTDRATDTARRKELYLQKYPETGHGGDRSGASGQLGHLTEGGNVVSFTTETAKKTGRSERKVRRDAERGEKVVADVRAKIRGTHLDNGLYLDALRRLPADEQRAKADEDLKKPRRKKRQKKTAVSVPRDPAKPYDDKTIERHFILLMDAWKNAPAAARDRFITEIGCQMILSPVSEATA